MRGVVGAHAFRAVVAECSQVQAGKEVLAGAKQDGADRQMRLVDEPGLKVLAQGRDPAPEPDIAAIGGVDGTLESRVDAIGHEMECGTPPP